MPRFCIHQLTLERLPIWISARVLDDNLFVVIGEFVDNVFDRFAELELIEFGDAVRRDGDTGRSWGVSMTSRTVGTIMFLSCILHALEVRLVGAGRRTRIYSVQMLARASVSRAEVPMRTASLP